MDRKVRKLLTTTKYHHPKYNALYLHTSRAGGRRDIVSILDYYKQECSSIAKYLETAKEEGEGPLTELIKERKDKKPPTISLTHFSAKSRFVNPMITMKNCYKDLHEIPMHGQWF